MRKIYSKLVSVALLSLIVLFQLQLFAQSMDELTVEGQLGFSSIYEEYDAPVFYPVQRVLSNGEVHSLPPLTKQERDFIESEFDPPAIGVYRALSVPVNFDLSRILIPDVYSESTILGGRLARVDEETMVWTARFRSEGADEIRLHFTEGNFPHGVRVNLFNPEGSALFQYQLRGLIGEYGFYTTTTFSDEVILQVVIPVEVIGEPLFFTIPGLTHAENKYLDPLRSCIQDAMCPEANSFTHINNLRLSAAQLTFVVGGGSYICSGGLLNDQRAKDLQPFFLTANHCFSTQASAASLEARFDFRTTSCNGSNNPGVILINGSNLIATNSQSDFTLVLLHANPALPRWYLGWTTGAPSNLSTLHSVHHPGGQRQRYTRLTLYTSPTHTCASRPTTHYHYSRNTVGESFGGSSGAPVVNASNQVIGQNWGRCFQTGSNNCDYSTYHVVWGKWSSSYSNNNLQFWLGSSPGAQVTMSTSPASTLNFGTRDVGSHTNLNVTVTNTGTVPNFLNLEAGNVTITGTNASQFSIVGNTSLYLAPGQSGTFTVRFSPTSNGFKTATLNIPHNADNIASPRTITLNGDGNPCSDAANLNNGGVANLGVFSRSGTGSWHTSSGSACGFTCPGRERIFYFTAPYTGTYQIHVTSTNSTWVNYMFRSGSCSSTGWTCIGDIINPGVYGSMALTAGTTYYILLDSETTATTTHYFYIGTPGRWEGGSGNSWFTTNNWYDGIVPTSTTDVTITAGKPNMPVIDGGQTANCRNLTIPSGSLLTMNSTSYLHVYGNLTSNFGQFIMNGSTSYLYFRGSGNNSWNDSNQNDTYTNVRVWKSDPAAITTMSHNMTTSGTFEIRSGVFALSTNRTLTVTSTDPGAFRVDDGSTLNLSADRTIDVTGRVRFRTGCATNITGGTIKCGGDFLAESNSGNTSLTSATVIMHGSGAQSIQDNDGNTIHHLIIDKPAGVASIAGVNLGISGNLTIDNGIFNLATFSCEVGGTTSINNGGTLRMLNASNDLTSAGIFWNAGSTAEVTAGTFHADIWAFYAGCNAMIGTGNTTYIPNMYFPTEPTAHFGNLVVVPLGTLLSDESRSIVPVNVAGNLLIKSGAAWTFPGPSGMIVTGNSMIESGGTLTLNSSAVFNTGGALQLSGTVNLNTGSTALVNGNFTFPSSGTLTINNGSFINDQADTENWTLLNGTFNLSNGLFELTNNHPQFTSIASTSVSGGIIRTGGAFAAVGSSFQPGGGVVEIGGISSSSGAIVCYGDNHFHDLLINRGGTSFSQSAADITIKNDLTIQSGIFSLHNIGGDLFVGGDFINMVGSGGFLHQSNKVIFNGTGAENHQHVTGTTNFYDIENAKTGSGELRFQGTTNIANDFLANGINIVSGPSLTAGGLFNLSTGTFLQYGPANPNVSVNNFTMGGSLNVASGTFVCTDLTNSGVFGIVNLSGGSITLNQDPGQFPDLRASLDISGGTMTINGGIGTSWWAWGGTPTHLNMTGGVLDFNTAGVSVFDPYNITTAISGGIIRTSGVLSVTHPNFTPTGGTAELYGNATASVRTENGSNFYNLIIDKSGGTLLGFKPEDDLFSLGKIDERLAGKDAGEDRASGKYLPDGGRPGGSAFTDGILNVTNNTDVNTGTFIINHQATNAGNVTINSGGKLEINNAGSLAMGASRSLTVNNGGALELNGSITEQPRITRISSGNYALNVESGASIGAVYALFEYMNTSGVNLKPGAMVNPAKAFHHSSLRNGQSGGRLMTINNSQTFAVNYVNFPNNTWGGTYNVFKTENAGVVTFMGFGGLFSGEASEWDPFSRVHWGGEIAPAVSLEGVEVVFGQDICFEATNTLTVGGGSNFDVHNGGHVELVAGQRIRMLEGTHFHSGSYGLARITTTSDYCSLPAPLMAGEEEKQLVAVEVIETKPDDKFFKVYPNPSTGKFTLELSEIASSVTVEIYGIMGEQILRQEVSGFTIYEFDLSTQARGIYIVRVLNGDKMEIQRVVKQ